MAAERWRRAHQGAVKKNGTSKAAKAQSETPGAPFPGAPSRDDSCGPGSRGSCGPRRPVSRTSRRPLSERVDPDSAGLLLDAASQVARAVGRDKASELARLLPNEWLPVSCTTICTWLSPPVWTCTALCETAFEPAFVELEDEWLSPEPAAVDSAFTHWVVGASWRITWT